MMLLQAAQQALSEVKFDPSAYSLDSAALNAFCVWVIQLIKRSNWPILQGINEGTPVRLLSVFVASLAAVGMTVDWHTVNGVGTLAISGISISSGLALVKNFLFQHGMYKIGPGQKKDNEALKAQIEELKKLVAVNMALTKIGNVPPQA